MSAVSLCVYSLKLLFFSVYRHSLYYYRKPRVTGVKVGFWQFQPLRISLEKVYNSTKTYYFKLLVIGSSMSSFCKNCPDILLAPLQINRVSKKDEIVPEIEYLDLNSANAYFLPLIAKSWKESISTGLRLATFNLE